MSSSISNHHQSTIEELFLAIDGNILRRRETNRIEFKECFVWNEKSFNAKIAKSAAGLANNKGGYIFFGIRDKPHEVIGINNFDSVDDAEISSYFNTIFSPAIVYERCTYTHDDMIIGVLFVEEHSNKPVICIKDTAVTNVSDIYYRYGAQTEKIKAGELLTLINDIRESETKKWLRLLEKASTIGVDNLSILNTATGELTSNTNTFLVDEALLSQIKFINKYSINDKGSPAIKVIGEIPGFTKVITQAKNIYENEVFDAFLHNLNVSAAEYLKAICHFQSENYPIYFLLRKLGAGDRNAAIEHLNALKLKSQLATNLINRINDEKGCLGRAQLIGFPNTKLGNLRKKYFTAISEQAPISLENDTEIKTFLECLYKFDKFNLDLDIISPYLSKIFKEKYPFTSPSLNYLFRYALTHVDWKVYGY